MTAPTGLNEPLSNFSGAAPAPQTGAFSARAIQLGSLCVESAFHRASFEGVPIRLTPIECEILELLARDAGRIVTRDELSLHLHRRPYTAAERAIDMHISHLRKKLASANGVLIRTARGAGYRLEMISEQRE